MIAAWWQRTPKPVAQPGTSGPIELRLIEIKVLLLYPYEQLSCVRAFVAPDVTCRGSLPGLPIASPGSLQAIGPIIASAMVAAIGDGSAFSKGTTSAPGSDWCRSQSRRGETALYLRVLFVQADWVVLSRVGQRTGSASGSNPGSRQRKSGYTITCWRLRSPTNSPVSPGRSQQTACLRVREDPCDGAPTCLILAPCSAPAMLRRASAPRRPGPRNGRNARTKEQREGRRSWMT
jgi:hypothetical protein